MFHVSEFIAEEMDARGWTSRDVAARMGGDPAVWLLALDLLLAVHDKALVLDTEMATALGRAFDVDAALFVALDRQCRAAA